MPARKPYILGNVDAFLYLDRRALTLFSRFVIILPMKKKTVIKISLFCFLGMIIMSNLFNLTAAAEPSELTELTKKLPEEIHGWKKSAEDVLYTPENLYKYINGGAELYISYDFKYLSAQKYRKEGSTEDAITVDIFDMGSASNAYGVFSHSRESVDHSISREIESEYAGGLLTFRKGKYYVSILAYPETEEKKKIILALGRHIARSIDEKNPVPPLVSRLPAENLVKESIRYFRHYIWLNSHYFISDQNILNIDKETEAVLAKYKDKGKGEEKSKRKRYDCFLLLISYPDKVKAEVALKSFLKHYLPDARDGIKQLEDGRWTGCKRKDNLIIVVLNALTVDIVNGFLNYYK